jgi:phage shock protein A
MSFLDIFGKLWTLAKKIEELFTLHAKMRESVEALDARLRALELQMIRFEADRSQLITEARAAANVAAVGVASATISDVVTRVTRIEMQQNAQQNTIQARLPPA